MKGFASPSDHKPTSGVHAGADRVVAAMNAEGSRP
jgi:hypothetical protein